MKWNWCAWIHLYISLYLKLILETNTQWLVKITSLVGTFCVGEEACLLTTDLYLCKNPILTFKMVRYSPALWCRARFRNVCKVYSFNLRTFRTVWILIAVNWNPDLENSMRVFITTEKQLLNPKNQQFEVAIVRLRDEQCVI